MTKFNKVLIVINTFVWLAVFAITANNAYGNDLQEEIAQEIQTLEDSIQTTEGDTK